MCSLAATQKRRGNVMRERERARPSERSTVHKHRHGVRDKSFFTRQIQLSGNESNRVLFKLYATAVRNVSAAFI